MKIKLLSALLVSALAPAAFAGTCASPTPITSTPMTITASSCGGDMGINLGGSILANPVQVYSFVWHDQGVTPNVLTVDGTNTEVDIGPNCTTAPIAGAYSGMSLDLTTAGFVEGQTYLMFVGIDPTTEPHNAQQCTDFVVNTGTLPVELQKFSVN